MVSTSTVRLLIRCIDEYLRRSLSHAIYPGTGEIREGAA
jgi:hypothetical protein